MQDKTEIVFADHVFLNASQEASTIEFNSSQPLYVNTPVNYKSSVQMQDVNISGRLTLGPESDIVLTNVSYTTMLDKLTDIEFVNLNDNDVMRYNETSAKWINTDGKTFDTIVPSNPLHGVTIDGVNMKAGSVSSQYLTLSNVASGVLHLDGSHNVVSSTVVNGDINDDEITNSKLKQITASGKVANSATTATATLTPSSIVARDALGDTRINALRTRYIMPLDTSPADVEPLIITSNTNIYFDIDVDKNGNDTNQYLFTGQQGTQRYLEISKNDIKFNNLSNGVVHSINSGSLVGGKIVNGDIDDNAISGLKMTDATVTDGKLVTVGGSKIIDGTVTDGKLVTVSGSKIIDGTVTDGKLVTVSGSKIIDGTVTDAKIIGVSASKISGDISLTKATANEIYLPRLGDNQYSKLYHNDIYNDLIMGSLGGIVLSADTDSNGPDNYGVWINHKANVVAQFVYDKINLFKNVYLSGTGDGVWTGAGALCRNATDGQVYLTSVSQSSDANSIVQRTIGGGVVLSGLAPVISDSKYTLNLNGILNTRDDVNLTMGLDASSHAFTVTGRTAELKSINGTNVIKSTNEAVIIDGDATSSWSNANLANFGIVMKAGGSYAMGVAKTRINAPIINSYQMSTGDSVPVYISSSGDLHIALSSGRYKENILPIDDTSYLYQLNPVKFNYISDKTKAGCIGLIAEEVERVNKNLVVYRDGKPETVFYDKLPIVMLNEMKKLKTQNDLLKAQVATMQSEFNSLKQAVNLLMSKVNISFNGNNDPAIVENNNMVLFESPLGIGMKWCIGGIQRNVNLSINK